MTETTRQRLPGHLKKYVVEQDYARYTFEDQAVWRYIMRQLKNFLSQNAHPSYGEGLAKSGLEVERIPHIAAIDQHLESFGWGAVPVSGFIPPAAFMEFQALGILPIASDMRSIDHLLYTPAPDIVHEAAGHAPILVNSEYGAYLRQYGEVARHAIVSKDDLAQYEAIRVLSDVKEDPSSTPASIRTAEQRLKQVNREMQFDSEAALLSRMNWWTAEYGLIGTLKQPRIYGAGLLSSVGESRVCLQDQVKKIPLSVDCVDYSYDITEPQPQLFVATDFAHLRQVLEELASRLAYRRGGIYGLERTKEAATVNTVELNSGVQISGQLRDFKVDHGTVAYLQFGGPCQLSWARQELEAQGTAQHMQGFSTPVGRLKGHTRCLSTFSPSDLKMLKLQRGQVGKLEFSSGVTVMGRVRDWVYKDEKLVLISWQQCQVKLGDELLFDPNWGDFDMAVGSEVRSVFAGPADRACFGQVEDFLNKKVMMRPMTEQIATNYAFYQRIREFRTRQLAPLAAQQTLEALVNELIDHNHTNWLCGIELLELATILDLAPLVKRLRQHLRPELFTSSQVRTSIQDGIDLAAIRI